MEGLVSVVVVTWNSGKLIERCLSPIVDKEGIEIIVFDNGSADNTVQKVRERFPRVKLIVSKINLGFGGGNNEAFKYCAGEFILLLNPDAFLDEQGTKPILEMRDYLRNNPQVAAVGPQLIHEDGRHQVGDGGWSTTLKSVAGHSLGLHKIISCWPSIYVSHRDLLGQQSVFLDWICGACVMVRADVVEKIGGFDVSIFMYGEDVEWGARMRTSGYSVVYLPWLKVLHIQGGTQKASGEMYFSTKWMDARAVHFKRTRSPVDYIMFKLLLVIGFLARGAVLGIVDLVRWRRCRRAVSMLRYAMHAARL